MNVRAATRGYEAWLARTVPLVPADLRLKHRLMAADPFSFLRATFYRWAQHWPQLCPELLHAPAVLAVGDLHIENFGTWRDAEGRLVWGINDFDEAARMPYTLDLVRLATSTLLALEEGGLSIAADRACEAILAGYARGISRGPKSFVLEESYGPIRAMALGEERDPGRFWKKMEKLPRSTGVPGEVRKLLARSLPDRRMPFRIVHRRAGLGSLGRPRFTALATWND